MSSKRTEEFKRDAVRMALTIGLPRKKLAGDLGVGLSTPNKWVKVYSSGDTFWSAWARCGPTEQVGKVYGSGDTVPEKEAELIKEIARLCRELRIVTEEREVLKKATAFFAGQKR